MQLLHRGFSSPHLMRRFLQAEKRQSENSSIFHQRREDIILKHPVLVLLLRSRAGAAALAVASDCPSGGVCFTDSDPPELPFRSAGLSPPRRVRSCLSIRQMAL